MIIAQNSHFYIELGFGGIVDPSPPSGLHRADRIEI